MPHIARVAVTAVVIKGVTMSTVLYLVLTSHLSEFEKGLIIASVSATITGAFTVLGAWLAARMAARRVLPLEEKAEEIHQGVHDVKGKIGASNRETDTTPQGEADGR